MQRESRNQPLFTAAYGLCLLDALGIGYASFGGLPVGDLPFGGTCSLLLRMGAAVLVLVKLILDRSYARSELIWLLLAGMLLLVSFWRSSYNHVFYLMVVVLGVRGVEIRDVLFLDFWLRLFLVCVVVVGAGTGLLENYATHRTGSDVLRYSMGFNHPNTLASLVLSLILEDAWLWNRRAEGWYPILVWAAALLLHWVTANRTAVLLLAVYPAALWLVQDRTVPAEPARKQGTAWTGLFPAAVLFSCAAMRLCRTNTVFERLDRLVGNRFYNARILFDTYGVSLFGQRVRLVSVREARLSQTSVALLDVACLRLLLQGGLLVCLLLTFLYSRAIGRAAREDGRLLLTMCVFTVFGLLESGFNNVCLNFTLLFAAQMGPAPEKEPL